MKEEAMIEREKRVARKSFGQTEADTMVDKANKAAVKPVTKLVMLGEEGAACHFVDGQIVCN